MISGHLRLVKETNEEFTCSSCYIFEADNGEFIHPVNNESNAPINVHIYASFEDKILVSWDHHPIATYIENDRKDVALVHVVNPGNVTESAWNRVNLGARRLERFIHHANRYKRWTTIRVTPYVIENNIGHGLGLLFPFNRSDVREQMEEQWPGRYEDHVYWHGLGGHRSGILGHAYVNSNRAWTFTGDWRTIQHEQGHNFGSNHSTAGNDEYGHPHCIMARARAGFCGAQMMGLGLIEEDHISYDDNNSTQFLAPLECNPKDLRVGEKQIVRLGNFVLSTRKTRDQSELGSGSDGTIYIERGPSFTYPSYHGQITPGNSRDVSDFTVKNVGNKEGITQVIIGNSPEKEYPKSLEPMASDVSFDNESISGLWDDPTYKRQGLDITVIPDSNQISGYWYTFHPRGSHGVPPARKTSREWFELDGTIINDSYIHVDIYHYPNREQVKVGEGTITIIDGIMKFRSYTKNFGRESLNLKRFTSHKKEWGLWKTGTHEGYSVAKYTIQNENRDIWVAYRYGHGGIGDLEWNVLDGKNLTDLTRHTFDGVYKSLQTLGHEQSSEAVNLVPILNNGEKLASTFDP
jgi:hypothetical protein